MSDPSALMVGTAVLGAIGGAAGRHLWDRVFGKPNGNGNGKYSTALCNQKHSELERRLLECEHELELGAAQFEQIKNIINDGFSEIRAFMAVINDRDRRKA